MPTLTPPHPRVRESYLEACAEFGAGLRAGLDLESLERPAAFKLYCRALQAGVLEWQHTYAGQKMRVMWWCDGDTYLGESTIRPDLTPAFGSHPFEGLPLELQGHVGYDVRPSARGRGHGRALLATTLREAYRLGVDPVVLTVHTDNVVSTRVVESCGGVPFTRPSAGFRQYLASGKNM
jgi:RimJ/RimL family protein N-acetyltransferase